MNLYQRFLMTLSQLAVSLLLLSLTFTAVVQAEDKQVETVDSVSSQKEQTDQANEQLKSETENSPEEDVTKGQTRSQIEDSMANIEVIQQTLEALRMEIESSRENASTNRVSVQDIRDGLELIETKLQEAYDGLDESRSGMKANTSDIKKLKEDLLAFSRDMRANTADLDSQKSLIEDNSVRLYEILVRVSSMTDQIKQFSKSLEKVQNNEKLEELQKNLENQMKSIWSIFSIILVLLAPVAFALSANPQHYKPLKDGTSLHQGILLVCVGAFLGYFAVGFSFTYGTSNAGLIGITNYLLDPLSSDSTNQPTKPFTVFLLYQAGFVMLAAMIIYSIVGRQLSSTAHLFLAVLVGAVVIPVFAHWTWASYFIPTNKGWLEGAGFIDQAGAVTINLVAAWFAFIMVLKLSRSAPPSSKENQESEYPVYSSSAVLFLWISWLGFTTGTLEFANEQISKAMLNVGLASSAGAVTAFLHYVFFHTDKSRIAHALGGFVSGLVAIAACAATVTFVEALLIGAVAGLLQTLAFRFLRRVFFKQSWQVSPAYLIAIHGFAGIWGALSVALFGTEDSFATPDFTQLITQVQGIAAAIVWSIVMAHIIIFLLKFRKKNKPLPSA